MRWQHELFAFQLSDLRLELLLVAAGADAVREPAVRVSGDVALHRLPIVLVVTDLPAIRADRQDRLQGAPFPQPPPQLLPQPLPFLLRLLARRDVTRHGVDGPLGGVRRRIQQEPAIRAVLAEVAVLEAERPPTGPPLPVLPERALVVIRVHELDERAGHQL